ARPGGGDRRRLPRRADRRRARQPVRRHLRVRRADSGAHLAAVGAARRARRRPGMKNQRIVVFAIAALACIALPLFAQQFGQGWVRIGALALLYVLLALGLNIVVGYAGLLDLGYVAFYAV